jgi:hypothetical protein
MEHTKSFFSRQKNFLRFIFFFSIVVFFSSCNDDPLEIGKNILPGDDSLAVGIDTLAVEVSTAEMEPILAHTLGFSLLGVTSDPVFGKIYADFLTDFTWADSFYFDNGIPENNFRAEKLEMIIKVNGYYGPDSMINYEVYELLSDFPTYRYSDYELPDELWDRNAKLNVGNTYVEYDTSNGDIFLHQRLSDDFMARLIDEDLILNDGIYRDEDAFRNTFKGLYVKNGFIPNDGGLVRVDYGSSRLVLSTFVTDTTGKEQAVKYEYVFGLPSLNGKSLNRYISYPAARVSNALSDNSGSHEYGYIQSLTGPKVRVSIPGLAQLRRELGYQASVNKAELIFPIDMQTLDMETYLPPAVLGMRDFVNDTNIIDDLLVSGYFGGRLDTARMEYRFNIGNYIHEYLRDSISFTDATLFVFGGRYITVRSSIYNPGELDITYYELSTPGRVVLNGSNASNPPLLRIIYSKFPE